MSAEKHPGSSTRDPVSRIAVAELATMSLTNKTHRGRLAGFADCAIFNMQRDDAVVHGAPDLTAYPALEAMCNATAVIPEVSEWIEAWVAREV